MDKMGLTRRTFLGEIGKMILVPTLAHILTVTGCENESLEERTQANQMLNDFPSRIPYAREVKKYETPEAKYCLVHVRSAHYVEITRDELIFRVASRNGGGLSQTSDPEFQEKVTSKWEGALNIINKTEKNIFDIMGYLQENYKLNEFFAEVAGPSNNTVERAENFYNGNLESLKKSGFLNAEFENGEDEKFKYIPGACLMLAKSGKMNMLGTESYELNCLAGKSENPQEYNDQREDYVLGRISQKALPLSLLIYGGGHNFGDNINRWNKDNPYKKFSLIEITPDNYSEKF